MAPSLFDFKTDPTPWLTVRTILSKALSDCPTTNWIPAVKDFHGQNPIDEGSYYRTELRNDYNKYAQLTKLACGERMIVGLWPNMESPIAYWSKTVLLYTCFFIKGICPRLENGEYISIFPFPQTNEENLALWFCTERWQAIGYEYFLANVTSDAALFTKRFNH